MKAKNPQRITITAHDNDSLTLTATAYGLEEKSRHITIEPLDPTAVWEFPQVPYHIYSVDFVLSGTGGGSVVIMVDGRVLLVPGLPDSLEGHDFFGLQWEPTGWRFTAYGQLL